MPPPTKSPAAIGTHEQTALFLFPNPAFLSSTHPPTTRIPDLERSLILEPGRWDADTAKLVLASKEPMSATVPVFVTLEQVYAMQEMEMKRREMDEGIEELNRVLEEEREKVAARAKLE